MRIAGLPPQIGPAIFSIPGISDVAVNGGASGNAGSVVRFRWPKTYKLDSWILLPRSGVITDAAALRVRMQDDNGTELVTDGVGVTADSSFTPALALAGIAPMFEDLSGFTWAPQWTPMQRVVKVGEQWVFQIFNELTAGNFITPWLGFKVREVVP